MSHPFSGWISVSGLTYPLSLCQTHPGLGPVAALATRLRRLFFSIIFAEQIIIIVNEISIERYTSATVWSQIKHIIMNKFYPPEVVGRGSETHIISYYDNIYYTNYPPWDTTVYWHIHIIR